MLRHPSARIVHLMLAAVLLAGCGSEEEPVPDGSDRAANSQDERSTPKQGGRDGGDENGNPGEEKKSIQVSSPLLNGFYPDVFGEFREEGVQCLAVRNESHLGAVRVTRVETSARRSSPKAFVVGSNAGSGCEGVSQAGATARSVGPCQGAELPQPEEQIVYCELWVELRPDGEGDYYGAVTLTVEGDCAAGEDGGPLCSEARESANSPVDRPITFWGRYPYPLRACLAEPRPTTGGEFEQSCDELRAEQGLTSTPSETPVPPENSETPEVPVDSPPASGP